MIREALAFHYLDDLDSKLAAARAALALDSGEPEWFRFTAAPSAANSSASTNS